MAFSNIVKNKTIIIIDIDSIRGSEDEQRILGVKETISKNKADIRLISKQQETLYGIVKDLLGLSLENMDIILYMQSQGKSFNIVNRLLEIDDFNEYSNNAENKFLKDGENQLRVLAGQQSLFYYIGWKSNQTK